MPQDSVGLPDGQNVRVALTGSSDQTARTLDVVIRWGGGATVQILGSSLTPFVGDQ